MPRNPDFKAREYEDLRRPFNYIPKQYEILNVPIIGGKENTAHPTTIITLNNNGSIVTYSRSNSTKGTT